MFGGAEIYRFLVQSFSWKLDLPGSYLAISNIAIPNTLQAPWPPTGKFPLPATGPATSPTQALSKPTQLSHSQQARLQPSWTHAGPVQPHTTLTHPIVSPTGPHPAQSPDPIYRKNVYEWAIQGPRKIDHDGQPLHHHPTKGINMEVKRSLIILYFFFRQSLAPSKEKIQQA